jgi:outer membrane lipoprotein SlyB
MNKYASLYLDCLKKNASYYPTLSESRLVMGGTGGTLGALGGGILGGLSGGAYSLVRDDTKDTEEQKKHKIKSFIRNVLIGGAGGMAVGGVAGGAMGAGPVANVFYRDQNPLGAAARDTFNNW